MEDRYIRGLCTGMLSILNNTVLNPEIVLRVEAGVLQKMLTSGILNILYIN